jgi:hypothetical protein
MYPRTYIMSRSNILKLNTGKILPLTLLKVIVIIIWTNLPTVYWRNQQSHHGAPTELSGYGHCIHVTASPENKNVLS